ncbi:MAG: hypothetical protein M3410_08085 [Acidobacteriota bacterium]|nr:hypothetical protein [Acidobacteriota bacterium]
MSARPRIEKAIAARGEEFSACNHDLFQIVSEIQYDPLLEEIGIKSLDDPDPQVAMTAATMLGKLWITCCGVRPVAALCELERAVGRT